MKGRFPSLEGRTSLGSQVLLNTTSPAPFSFGLQNACKACS